MDDTQNESIIEDTTVSVIEKRHQIVKVLKDLDTRGISPTDIKVMHAALDGALTSGELSSNLQALHREGIVRVASRPKPPATSLWALTGKEYKGDTIVKLLISLPESMHATIKKVAKSRKISMNSFIVNALVSEIELLERTEIIE